MHKVYMAITVKSLSLEETKGSGPQVLKTLRGGCGLRVYASRPTPGALT